jgi:serine/threonine protein kinase/formylglycine-generating enzyme required for sulfatase activity
VDTANAIVQDGAVYGFPAVVRGFLLPETPANSLEQETLEPQGHGEYTATPRPATAMTTAFDAERPISGSYGNPVAEGLAQPEVGFEIDHFRVVRQLGQGGMGRVLLARDLQLGRLVALKLIREDRMDRDALDAFLAEARMTAALSHPNIVTIHHIGHWQHSMYLALEYVEGGTLRERIAGQVLHALEAMRLALPIARALEAAHAALISHRDLKPENVLVPPDGRLRVVDFGIARVIDDQPRDAHAEGEARVSGTPGYMAPEQWRGEPPMAPVDVWALGAMLYEMLMGHRPFEGPDNDGRPMHMRVLDPEVKPQPLLGVADELRLLVEGMLARDAGDRPTAAEVARGLERQLSQDADPGKGTSQTESPFRGLLPFEERHAQFFFGREPEVDAAVERLRTSTILAIIGPSGAGKSSFVQAGVLPRMREHAPLTVLSLRPGPHPLAALATRLIAAETVESKRERLEHRDAIAELTATLATRPGQANVALHELADATRTRVVLFVDQLEEVATQGCPPEEARAFLDAVALAADAVDDQVRVIFTLRDDFLARVAVGEAMTAALNNVLVVRRLDDQLLREAATRPLARLGYAWDDPELVNRIVEELHGLTSALPLLQFACAALWERRDQRHHLLRRTDYEAIGGVAGALAAHAEAVFDGLAPQDLEVARVLLLRLVAADGARLVVPWSRALDGLGERGERLAERLANARLLTVRRSRVAASDEAVLELTHDSLLRDWPQLRKWLDETSEERLALAEVEDAARVWHSRGRAPREVWPLDGVLDVRRRLRAESVALSQTARDFLLLGETLGQRDARRKRWAVVGSLALALVITVTSVTAALAFAQKERETKQQALLIQRAAAERALAAADTGLVQLDVQLFDWDAQALRPVAVKAEDFPQLQVTLWEVDTPDAPTPVRPRDAQFLQLGPPERRDTHWRAQLQTHSGPVFLRFDGRGKLGETCPPSWLKVRRLPGWSEREHGATPLALQVPTCAASRAGDVTIPAGPFYFAGEGNPPLPGVMKPDPEELVLLPTFAIDRTETPNGWYAAFTGNRAATGLEAPQYTRMMMEAGVAKPEHPVAAIDAYGADAFCAWLGKRLPTTQEWSKAGRGGLTLDAEGRQLNPQPRRNLPWGNGKPSPQFNLQDPDDPWRFSAPVAADTVDASPYGVLGMADNVAEWTSSAPKDNPQALRTIRGGDWGNNWSDGVHSLAIENARSPRYFAFSLGFRCAQHVPAAPPRAKLPP